MNKKPPLTDLERQKAFNIRQTTPTVRNDSARDIMKTKVWDKLNTHGNPKKK